MSICQPVYLRKFNSFEDLASEGPASQMLPLKEASEVGTGFEQYMGAKWHKQNGIDLRLE
jgi:hypothetical protein